ncbi:MAG: ABC transporter permease [Gemmatimonadales bacterium]
MLRFLTRRLVVGIAVVLGVVTLTFVLLHVAPGDPVLRLLGPTATPEQIEAQRRVLGLDQSIVVQYVRWVSGFLMGDWGISIATGHQVTTMIWKAWPATALLVGLSLTLSYLLGVLVGTVQAVRRGTRLDRVLTIVTVTLFAIPGYWLGLMLVMMFTYWLKVLPAFGAAGLDSDFLSGWPQFVDRIRHLALPLTTLVLIGIGGVARFVRGSMVEVLDEPFVVAARARGLPQRRVILRHGLRNASIPLITLLGLSLPALFSGAVFIEAVFAWPGVGRVLVEAVQARDFPVVMAATAVSATLVVIGNLAADVAVAWADPRVRRSDG